MTTCIIIGLVILYLVFTIALSVGMFGRRYEFKDEDETEYKK